MTGDNARLRRFLMLVEVNANGGDCWVWCGTRQTRGYGSVTNGRGGTMLAHRASWELHRGPIADGLTVDHLCHNKLCMNPEHLELVPQKVNAARGSGCSSLYCVNDHPLFGTLGDWTRRPDGKRRCNVCARARAKAQREHERGPRQIHNGANHGQ